MIGQGGPTEVLVEEEQIERAQQLPPDAR